MRKLHRYLRTQAYQLQKSVFAWQGKPAELVELQKKMACLVRPSEDDVRSYRIPVGQLIEIWGVNPLLDGLYNAGNPPLRHRLQGLNSDVAQHRHPTQACMSMSMEIVDRNGASQ